MNILIIEDDSILIEEISRVLCNNILVNKIKCISTYYEFLDIISSIKSFDIIITDILLNCLNKNGLDIIKYVRSIDLKIPIIVVSSVSSYSTLEDAFSIGANDYIIKPFRIREFEIRINKWIHNYIFSVYFSRNKVIEYKGLCYDFGRNIFYYQGQQILLTKKVKYLLFLFLLDYEKVLSIEYLSQKLWGDIDYFSERNLRINILRLKKNLALYNLDSWISNLRGEGYILKHD